MVSWRNKNPKQAVHTYNTHTFMHSLSPQEFWCAAHCVLRTNTRLVHRTQDADTLDSLPPIHQRRRGNHLVKHRTENSLGKLFSKIFLHLCFSSTKELKNKPKPSFLCNVLLNSPSCTLGVMLNLVCTVLAAGNMQTSSFVNIPKIFASKIAKELTSWGVTRWGWMDRCQVELLCSLSWRSALLYSALLVGGVLS